MSDVSLLFNVIARDKTGAGLGSAQSRFSKFQSAVKVGSLAMAGGLLVAGKAAISAASDYTEASNKADAVFKDQVGTIRAFEQESTAAWGISKKAALDYTGSLGSVLVASGVNRAEAAKLSVQYTKLAADLGSFNNTSTEEAAEALKAALTGEVEQMKKYGVVMNETVLKAEALSSGLLKASKDGDAIKAATIKQTLAQRAYTTAMKEHGAGSKEALSAEASLTTTTARLKKLMEGSVGPLDANTKRQAIQNVIMRATADAQGDVARNTDTAAFKQRNLQARMDDLQVTVGQKLLPIYIKFLGQLQSAADWAGRNATTVKILVGGLAALWAVTVGVAMATKVWTAVTTLAAAATKAWAFAQRMLTIAMIMFPIGVLVLAIAGLVAIIILIATKTTWFQQIWHAAWGAIKGVVSGTLGWIRANWPLLLAILTGPVGLAVLAIKKHGGTLVSFFKGLPGKILGALGDFGNLLVQKGKDFISGFGRGAEQAARSLPFGMGKVIGWAIDGVAKATDSHSPSRVMMKYGRWFVEGFAIGVKDKTADVVAKAQDMITKLKEKLDEVKDFSRGIREQFQEAANPTSLNTGEDKSFGGLLAKLQQQRDAAREFVAGIKALRKQGLNELTLSQLRSQGVGSLDTVRALLGGDVGQVNSLVGDIDAAGKGFGNSEAKQKFGLDPSRKQVVEINLTGADDDLLRRLRKEIRVKGGNVQVVLGGKAS